MKVIVCGAGEVGSTIAKQLSAEDNHVTVIDQSEALVRNIADTMDVRAIHGHASHPEIIERAGGADADMLVAVTNNDETNMVCCQIAHTLFKIPVKIARLRHQSYLDPEWKELYRLDHMPIDVVISPEIEVAEAIIRRLHVPGATDMIPYANDVLKLISVQCTSQCPVINLPLKLIKQRNSGNLRMSLMGIVHKNKFHLPHDERILHTGDEIFFLAHSDDVSRAMTLFGHEEKEARRVMIMGGGNIGLTVAKMLEEEDSGVRLKLIELNKARAENAANELPDITVLNGSGLDQEVLNEANINLVETLIAVTNDDKVNVISSLLAKRLGAQRAITLVNSSSYAPLLDNLGIDVTVNPRETTVSTILQHIRRGKIRGVHAIHDGVAEVMEVEAVKGSPLIGKTIAAVEFPAEAQIGAVVRGKGVFLPDSEKLIQENDRVVVLSMTKSVRQVENILSRNESLY
jgi:trk system potassium uptake protein TrkA